MATVVNHEQAYDAGYMAGYFAYPPAYAGGVKHLRDYVEGYLDGEESALSDACADFRWEWVMESWAD
jgi:hypothetical protein